MASIHRTTRGTGTDADEATYDLLRLCIFAAVALLLCRRARGQLVAGTLLGVASGSIIAVGVCGSVAVRC